MKHLQTALCLALLAAPAACGRETPDRLEVDLKPGRHELVDNLIVIPPRQGNGIGPLARAVGVFTLEGRCLILRTDEAPTTPILVGRSVKLSRDGLRINGRDLAWGSEVRFPVSGGPVTVAALKGGDCPIAGQFVRAPE
jgi:hypothetical protein